MPEILTDVTRLLIRSLEGRLPTGVDRVCQAYIRHFRSSARAVLHRGAWGGILSRAASQDLFDLLLEPVPQQTRKLITCIAASPLMPLSSRRHGGSLLFNIGHSGLERPAYTAWIAQKQLRPLYMVHDLIPLTHPEYCRPGELDRHTARMNTVVRTAAGIVTNSQATLDELTAFADSSRCSLPPSVAALLAPPPLDPAAASPLDAPYFVILGTIEPRKNHWMLLQVWRRLVERHGADAAPRLVVIGQRGWECENVVDLLERGKELQGVVLERPSCSDAELATWLKHARALLFPSFSEGYGLPLVEALALGTPVIASNLPVFREIAGDIPEYLDPLDGMGWLDSIEAYAGGASPLRAAQLDRLRGYCPPSWDTHFKAVETLLEKIR